ncbi:MAG TPA: TonB-dependent receptor [Lacunisphaera sp.]|nr:TonB-dependent receptor [Lacunisphaera sp.]
MQNITPPKPLPALRTAGRGLRKAVLAALGTAALTTGVYADDQPSGTTEKNLADLSIEELMNEPVTSVSKKEQRLVDVAAAVTVLTNDDLRRAGVTSLPDALRLVPGMDVGTVNSRESAVSARGFNSAFSNKLLVLVDGRAVYTPLFAGVYWDLQQPMLEDVDRIEVIRGPGATVWGANAVNGVINVVSRSARDTQGTLIYAGGGDVHEALGGVRYGGQIGAKTYYRIFATFQANGDYPLADGQPAHDHWQGWTGGFRLDHYPEPDTHLTWQADATGVDHNSGYNANTLGRWTRQLTKTSSVEVQAYYDRTYRNDPKQARLLTDIFDVTLQHTFDLTGRNAVIWGFGYRYIGNKIEQTTPQVAVLSGDFHTRLFSAFVQDEFKLVPGRLTLTAGAKLEHNDITRLEFQPSVRLVFNPTGSQTVWAAVSRAVRTPDEQEGRNIVAVAIGPPLVGPDGGLYLPSVVGNPALKSEALLAYELGYRIQPTKRVSLELAAFSNHYDNLITYAGVERFVPGTPFGLAAIPGANLYQIESYGGEATLTVSPADSWRVTAGYALDCESVHRPAAMLLGPGAGPPRHQASLRSAHDLTPRTNLDVQLRYVSGILATPAYFTADFRLAYRPTSHLELSLVGQNLLDQQHPEQPPVLFTLITGTPRGFYAKILWRF